MITEISNNRRIEELESIIAAKKAELQELKNKPIVYGYARVSTTKQAKDGNSLVAQQEALIASGATIIYSDAYTGTTNSRPELEKLLSLIKPGDKLIVTKLDRIARSVQQGIGLINDLCSKNITVQVLNIGILDNSPTGKLLINVMLAFAEFEREMILQRTREGKSIAKDKTGYKEGRPNKYSKKQIDHALKLLDTYSYSQVTEITGISKSTLIRKKKEAIDI